VLKGQHEDEAPETRGMPSLRNAGARAWTKKQDLPPGISLMGFSTCPKCNRPALHIKGDPDAVAEVTVMYEDHMGAKEPPDARLTDLATGKPRLDG
jgi:hypothetical protein